MSELDANIRQLAIRFLPEWRERVDTLIAALGAEPPDLQGADQVAHQLAGALGSFGFAEAGALARGIEVAIRAGNPEEAVDALPGFLASFGHVVEELERQ